MATYIKTVDAISRSVGRKYEPVPNDPTRFYEVVDTNIGSEVLFNGNKVRPESRAAIDPTDIDIETVVPPVPARKGVPIGLLLALTRTTGGSTAPVGPNLTLAGSPLTLNGQPLTLAA